MRAISWALLALGSLALMGAALLGKANMTPVEALGFITGAVCVWLVVKEHIWNWPIGIASSAFYVVVFFRARLFADMSLQVVYIVLGFLGWYWWLHGGKNRTELPVSRTPLSLYGLLVALIAVCTYGMTKYLRSVQDSAPFIDALTTVLSLAAQYMLTKKYIENWYVWIVADVIYVFLYISRHLYLTSLLYALYLAMCVAGLREWQRSMESAAKREPVTNYDRAVAEGECS